MQNITVFFTGSREVTTRPLYRYDRGQRLIFANIALPYAFEVHFSNSETGTSTTQIGTDGGVDIPDQFFNSGADIYAYLYLHNEADDSETVYKVHIPVRDRPEITEEEPTPEQQSAIDQAITALNDAITLTEDNVDLSEQYAEEARQAASEASESASAAERAKDDAEAAAARAHSNFATFYVDPETGILTAHYTPDNMELQFALSDKKHLEVIIP